MERVRRKHAQTPAYLRCLAGIIIAAHCKHTQARAHARTFPCARRTKAEELLPYHLQTKRDSQETVQGLTGMDGLDCTAGPQSGLVTGRQVLPFFHTGLRCNMFQGRFLALQTGRSGNILMLFIPPIGNRGCINKNITAIGYNTAITIG